VRSLGLDFGLWVEPEMVNQDSELFRAHPDWILSEPGRIPTTWRSQHTGLSVMTLVTQAHSESDLMPYRRPDHPATLPAGGVVAVSGR